MVWEQTAVSQNWIAERLQMRSAANVRLGHTPTPASPVLAIAPGSLSKELLAGPVLLRRGDAAAKGKGPNFQIFPNSQMGNDRFCGVDLKFEIKFLARNAGTSAKF